MGGKNHSNVFLRTVGNLNGSFHSYNRKKKRKDWLHSLRSKWVKDDMKIHDIVGRSMSTSLCPVLVKAPSINCNAVFYIGGFIHNKVSLSNSQPQLLGRTGRVTTPLLSTNSIYVCSLTPHRISYSERGPKRLWDGTGRDGTHGSDSLNPGELELISVKQNNQFQKEHWLLVGSSRASNPRPKHKIHALWERFNLSAKERWMLKTNHH